MRLNDKKNVKRLGIFFFYDNDGVVDDYVIYMLEDMVMNTSHNIVVCNGKLSEEGRKRFEALPNTDILVRENKGFDVWAYKSALEYYGWDVIDTYDEIFMYNFTIMGPVGHFSTMFEEMDQEDLDFWGITIHNGAPFDPWGNMREGKIPIHIQSHFIAVRNKMIQSEEFHKYWDERPMINCYEDAVGLHEAIFTGIFEKAGYKWDVYVKTEDLIEETFYPLFNMPVDLIKNRKCPIFKRKLFINDFTGTIQENANLCARELFDYLKYETDYDTDMIIKHLLRSAELSDIVCALNLNYILESTPIMENTISKNKFAYLASTLEWENHFYEYLQLLSNIPSEIEVYLIVNSKQFIIPEKENFHVLYCEQKETNSEFIKKYGHIIKEYDVVGIMDDYGKDISEVYSNILGSKDLIYREMLESEGYIRRIMELFECNQCLGMLVPNSPIHALYYSMIGREWRAKYRNIQKLINKCGINRKLSESKVPPIAYGNCCWIRTNIFLDYIEKNIQPITESKGIINVKKNWSYIMPLLAQNKGYYTANISSSKIAQNLLNTFYKYTCLSNTNNSTLANVASAKQNQRFNITSEIYFDCGDGFHVKDVIKKHIFLNAFNKEKVEIRINIPKNVRYIRFDPCEGFMCICSKISCNLPNVRIHNYNGLRFGTEDLFLTKDPQYILEGDFSKIKRLVIKMENMSIFWNENGLEKEINAIFDEKGEFLNSIQYLTSEYNNLLQEKNDRTKELEQKIKELHGRIKDLEEKSNQLLNENICIKNSRSWRWTSLFRKRKK